MVDVRPTNAKLWARAIRIVRALSGPRRRGGAQDDREGGRARQGRAGHAPRGRERRARARSCWSSTRDRCGRSSAIWTWTAAAPTADATTDGRARRRRARDERRPARAALLALRERPRRIVIGLLSGTSADGTDAALCEIAGVGENTGLVARAFVTTPFPRPLRERIYRLSQADASELTDLDVLLGEAFADGAPRRRRRGRRRAWPTSTSSARTARPPSTTRARPGSWARRCRSARRPSSPSAPAARWSATSACATSPPAARARRWCRWSTTCCSASPAAGARCRTSAASPTSRWSASASTDLVAFDNAPRQHAARHRRARGLRRAARPSIATARAPRAATIDVGPAGRAAPPPLPVAAAAQVDRPRDVRQGLRLPAAGPLRATATDDLLATLTRFSAEAIARSYREMLPAMPDEVFISGGGALNPTLMRHLAELLAPIPVATSAALGVDPRPRRRSRSRCSPTRRCSAPPATSRPSPARSGRACSEKFPSERAGRSVPAADALRVDRDLVDPGGESGRRGLVGRPADAEVGEHHRQVRLGCCRCRSCRRRSGSGSASPRCRRSRTGRPGSRRRRTTRRSASCRRSSSCTGRPCRTRGRP